MTIKFGTDGWRSRVDADFTTGNVRRVARAIADYILGTKPPGKGVFIGYDGRSGSRGFAEACAEVLAGRGIQSFMPSRPVPTPVAAFAAVRFSLSGSIMITASHNPAVYNGIKFIPFYGGPATVDITEAIERLIPEKGPDGSRYAELRRSGGIAELDPLPAYADHVGGLLSADLNLRVAVDPMHGATAGVIDALLRRAGAEVLPIRGTVDPDFGGALPDPTPSALSGLREAVVSRGLDAGVALDGDGDRLAVVTRQGEFLMANQLLPMIYLHLMDEKGMMGDAARTVATSGLVDSVARSHGRDIVEVPVGFKYIGALLREGRVVIGGEESGGISFAGHIPEKDGMASALLAIESAASAGKTLDSLMDEIYRRYGHPVSERLDLRGVIRPDVINRVGEKVGGWVAGRRVARVNRTDGLKLEFSDGSWLLFRKSGTEDVVRIYAESGSAEETRELICSGKVLIESA